MKSRLAHWFIGQSRPRKALILIGADVVFAVLALWSAFSLRWGVLFVPRNIEWILILIAPVLAVPIFIRLGLYRAIIRYIEMKALWTIVQAVTIYAGAFAVIYFLPFIFYESGIRNLPRTVPILNWLIMTLLVGSSRFYARWWLGDTYTRLSGGHIFCSRRKKCSFTAPAVAACNWPRPWRSAANLNRSRSLMTTRPCTDTKSTDSKFTRFRP
jgi:hypothetical protein